MLAVGLSAERTTALEEVEGDDVRPAVCVARTKAHRPEQTREKGDVVVFDRLLPHLALRIEMPDHVQAKYVRLALLECAGLLLERGAHRALAVDSDLDTEAMCDFVEHHVLEKSVEGHARQLIVCLLYT